MRVSSITVIGLAVAIGHGAAAPAQTPAPLRVIRTMPGSDANALSEISITFDRPVAGSLDRSVDAESVFRIEPAVAGRLEWRDPVTIRLRPTGLLTAGTTYTVTIANSFRSMDGGALAQPYRFAFRVQGPAAVYAQPRNETGAWASLALDQRFDVVYSMPVDLAKLASTAYVEFSRACAGGARVARLHAVNQRRVGNDDVPGLERHYAPDPRYALDSLRRIVQLAPDSTMPRNCIGELVAPKELDDLSRGYERWRFVTHGDFRVSALTCSDDVYCPRGPLKLTFTTPVSGATLLRNIKLVPDAKIIIRDTVTSQLEWMIEAKLEPRTTYALVVDTAIRDVFGERLRGNPAAGARTTGYRPSIDNPFGLLVVERTGMRALSVQHLNVDTLLAVIAPIPDSLEAKVLGRFGWANDTVWSALVKNVPVQRIPVRSVRDRGALTNVRLPVPDARRPGSPTLYAVRVRGRADSRDQPEGTGPIAVVQVTDLGVHARVGTNDAAVWVTSVNDGLPKQGATVVLYNAAGKAVATGRTDARGLVRLTGWKTNASRDTSERETEFGRIEGYVKVTLGDDRAVTTINQWDEDLSPWRFNVMPAWGDDRIDVAGAVFAERGIYRPGERVYAKAIVRDGPLGALRTPAAGDSLKWRFHDRDQGMLREVTTRLSSFGTASQSLALPTTAAVGYYNIEIQAMRQGGWRTIGRTTYRVAEYRPPEFLVDVRTQDVRHLPGDTLTATVQSRYLFGAPMGRAAFTWMARQSPVWYLDIPGTDGWYVGDNGSWWEENLNENKREFASGTDTLDVRGERAIRVQLPAAVKGRASNISLQAVVFDVNRQVVAASMTTLMHPADFYVAVKPRGTDFFWKAGTSQTMDVIAVHPDGQRESNVRVTGTVVRHEWHRVRRERDGMVQLVGDWVSDTVETCTLTTGPNAVPCTITPKSGGTYTMTFSATDRSGRLARTSFVRWASGTDWVPWNDESQFKMDVVPDKPRYSVGDTATILFASPFTNAEAWVTVEREGLIDQRRLRITSGSTTLKVPITEKFAPNAFVSMVVTRGRSAPPGPLDDPGRPTIRVGYAELRVTPEVKRLALTIAADKPEYRPADSARIRVSVRDVAGRGARSEVTLWAVDEGVLSLTGYKTPDPIDLIYSARGLGMRLGSNLTSVAPQVPEGEKGKREPGGGGGADGADVLRSRFQTTAFFLGSVVTDAQGNGSASVKLPDNLTTFRVMAVAVTAGDRYGKGESSLLVTRPLLARQALPRFVRPGDQFTAGAVINRRDGAAATVKVRAAATGVTLRADSLRTVTLAASRGSEVRFPFVATRADSASFRFDVTGEGGMADAVRVTLPVRPDYHPVAHTIAGVLRDTATVDFALPAGIDPARSRLSISVAVSPLAMIRGIGDAMHVYPYYCTEQVISAAMPVIALYRAQRQSGTSMFARDPRPDIVRAVEMLIRRQRTDGGIGYWSPDDWTSAWLSAYAGLALIEARDVGVGVDPRAMQRLADYVTRDLHSEPRMSATPLGLWYDRREIRLRDRVAAVDFLSRLGKPDVPAENELLRQAALLALEDRARLAEVLMRRKQVTPAKRLMTATWQRVRVEGSRAAIIDSTSTPFYFQSYLRPFARILTATLAVDPNNALVGPLVESLVQPARAGGRAWMWNSQDYASAVFALAAFDRTRRTDGERTIRVRARNQVVLESGLNRRGRDSTIALTGLLADANGGRSLHLSLDAGPGSGSIYYYMTVTEIPTTQPVTPEDRGIRVERWYERFPGTTPVTSVAEGDLVRVRIRVTVPTTRQFVVLDDALPAGLEAIDLSLRTAAATPGPGTPQVENPSDREEERQPTERLWSYGSWDAGWWSPFDHRELRDDRVVYSATVLWPGVYTATYLARATTPGTFIRPPAHAEEMYNPGVNGRSDGGSFVVTARNP